MPPLAIGDDDLETLCGRRRREHPRGRPMTATSTPAAARTCRMTSPHWSTTSAHRTRRCATTVRTAVLAGRVTEGRADEHLAALGDAGAALLADPAIQARSFGALLLALVVDRVNVLSSGIPDHERGRRDACGHSTSCAGSPSSSPGIPSEPDLGATISTLGWLHAVAHGADTLGAFARLTAAGRVRAVDAARHGGRARARTDGLPPDPAGGRPARCRRDDRPGCAVPSP